MLLFIKQENWYHQCGLRCYGSVVYHKGERDNVTLWIQGYPGIVRSILAHGGRGHVIRERPIANIEARHKLVHHREMTLGTWTEGLKFIPSGRRALYRDNLSLESPNRKIQLCLQGDHSRVILWVVWGCCQPWQQDVVGK